MKGPERTGHGGGDVPTNTALLVAPLDFICADHQRERQVCAMIDAMAAAAVLDRQGAMRVLRFLNEELNVHLRDEVEDLFPLLSQRCTDEDSIDRAISRIGTDQRAAIRLLPDVRRAIAGCLDAGTELSVDDLAILSVFAGQLRRVLVAENAILLPIARARLTRSDLALLSAHMRARRGLSPDPEMPDAD